MGFPNMSSESANIEVIAGRIAADGTTTAGKGFSSAIANTNEYTITLDREYNGLISAVATPIAAAGDELVCLGAVSAFPADAPGATLQFETWDGSDGTTASASEFCFVIVLTRGDA